MFKLQAKSNVDSNSISSEVFVIGDFHLAINIAQNLLSKTSYDMVEIFRKNKDESIAVLAKSAMSIS